MADTQLARGWQLPSNAYMTFASRGRPAGPRGQSGVFRAGGRTTAAMFNARAYKTFGVGRPGARSTRGGY